MLPAMHRSPAQPNAEACTRLHRLIQIGVGHDDHMVLRATGRLHSFPVCGARLIDVFRHSRAADERYGPHLRMREQRVDRFLVAVQNVEDPRRQAGFMQELGQPHRRERHLLTRLQDKRIAARDGDRKHPKRHHRRKVERRDADANADRMPRRFAIDARRDILQRLPHQQARDAA
ncbi:MAG: hypothetical protein QM775_29520 [Pirellulales bacterium]